MPRQKRTPGLGDVPITRARGGARDRLRDAGGKELALLARRVGNSQVGALLGEATKKRDALLAFVERRLREIQYVQRAEQKELGDHRDWHMRVARGATTVPDPTRWHKTTQLHRRAAEALCAGDLSRGAHLLDQAVAAERAAFETVPAQVELASDITAPDSTPEQRPFVTEGETCPATKAPALFQRADAILHVTETSVRIPGLRSRRLHHWWDTAEDEVDGGDKKDSKTGGGKNAGKAEAVPSAPSLAATETVEKPAELHEKHAEQTLLPARDVAREFAAAPQKPHPGPRKGKKSDGR